MPNRAKYYAYAVVAAGAAILASSAALWICQSPQRFLVCLILALLGSTMKVKLPGMDSCITPSFVPLLFAAGTMSWQETAMLAAAAGAMQTLWKPKRPPMTIQVLFNAANLAIAIGVGFAVSHSVAPNQILVQLAVAVTAFEILNTLSVSTVVCLVSGSSLRNIWRNCHLWAFPYHLSGAVLAAVWTQRDTAMSASITILGAISLYLMSEFYRELVCRSAARSGEAIA